MFGICWDCFVYWVNGEVENPDPTWVKPERFVFLPESDHSAPEADYSHGFSKTPCATCGSPLAGLRWWGDIEG